MKHSQLGLSLVEALLIIAMTSMTVLLLVNIPNALSLIGKSRQTSLAREIAAKAIEDKRTLSYINLANTPPAGDGISDSRMSLLPSGSGIIMIENCDQSVCPNGEAIKKITVTIKWLNNGKQQDLIVTTLIGQGGLN